VYKVSAAFSQSDIEAIIKKVIKGDAVLVVWQMNRIIWGIWQDGEIVLSDGSRLEMIYVNEMRVFNEQGELHLSKSGDAFSGRYREDQGNQSCEYVDTVSRFWGSKGKREKGFVELNDEERKIQLTVPCDKDGKYYGLVTRNYIGINDKTGQAGYDDYRYVRIISGEGGREHDNA
jgi:CRISPR-associated protein (TIGR03984 family)